MRTLYGDDEHSWYLQRVRDFTCRDCRVPCGATWCRNTFVTAGNCQIACCHVHADCLATLQKRPLGTQCAFSPPQRGISFCSLLSQACQTMWFSLEMVEVGILENPWLASNLIQSLNLEANTNSRTWDDIGWQTSFQEDMRCSSL